MLRFVIPILSSPAECGDLGLLPIANNESEIASQARNDKKVTGSQPSRGLDMPNFSRSQDTRGCFVSRNNQYCHRERSAMCPLGMAISGVLVGKEENERLLRRLDSPCHREERGDLDRISLTDQKRDCFAGSQ